MKSPDQERVPRDVTFEEAIMEIGEIMQDVSKVGANDSEIPDLRRVLDSLRKGVLEPQEAVAQAHRIKEGKQDYH